MEKEEIWKDIKGFEGLYQISSLGRVKSLLKFYPRLFNPTTNKLGYGIVTLTKNKRSKSFYVHKLVAEAFIPNPNNYPCINHKDENPSNNCVENLEWCTYKYNSNYGTRNERISKIKGRPVNQYTLDGKFIKTYSCAPVAGRETHISRVNIWKCCISKEGRTTCGGYMWKYADEEDNNAE